VALFLVCDDWKLELVENLEEEGKVFLFVYALGH
jgi:hypothetical protein